MQVAVGGLILMVGVAGCARSESSIPPAAGSTAPPPAASAAASASGSAPAPAPEAAPAPAKVPATTEQRPASGIGGPCFASLVRNADGKPSVEQKCVPGLACDYEKATPDGTGRCRRR